MTNCTFYDSVVNDIYSLSRDQLYELQNVVDDAVNKLEMERMIGLQDKAINAIRDIQKAGGSIIYKPNCVGFVDVIRGVYYEVTIY